jgi:hypothetical protein
MKISITLFLINLLFPLPALANGSGGSHAFGIIFCVIMVVAMAILIAVKNAERARQNELVKNGKPYFS